MKHGLSGSGAVIPEFDAEEILRRVDDLTADLKPRSPAGEILIERIAICATRMNRAASRETAAIATMVRHAPEAFDEARIEAAEKLFDALLENPRAHLRKLRRSPEGVERLVEGWLELRDDLMIEPEPVWTTTHLEAAASMIGLKAQHARGSRFGDLSRGFSDEFGALCEEDAGSLDDRGRRDRAKAGLIEQIDAEIAELEALYETLDFELIAIDRAEAGERALFDFSKDATLARRYESEASRGFFKALKEFREVEAEFEARHPSAPNVQKPPPTPRPEPRLGSSREIPPPPERGSSRIAMEELMAEVKAKREREGQPMRAAQPTQNPQPAR